MMLISTPLLVMDDSYVKQLFEHIKSKMDFASSLACLDLCLSFKNIVCSVSILF